jgi:putative hydrolase of the HAD superfamily
LWHNEARFHLTQTALRDLLRRHVPDADIDSRLSEVEMRNLSLYGYGVKAFTLSMLETAIEVTEGRIPTADLEVILGWGKRMLGEPTELLDGVETALEEVSRRYEMLLITKGDLFDQESKLARSGLAAMFSGVEVLSEKNVESYRSVLRRRKIEPEEFVMVGNSLRSDIAPVIALGARGVHIPYPLTWHHEQVPEDSMPREGWHRLGSIAELAALLDSL